LEKAKRIAMEIGIKADEIEAECLPEQKVNVVRRLQKDASPVVMVGDGINDAPALTAANVGIALGGHSFSAASESGDIVILVDDIGRVGEALWIGHAVLRIAKESIIVGIGLSAVLMVIAAFGYIPPVIGALLQEVIDVLVILNALRVLFIKPA
jgi:P-type E1-E2 ATPase